jgi:hypothetical protein
MKDPIAQKHAARIKRLRGTYDRYGNRIPPEFLGGGGSGSGDDGGAGDKLEGRKKRFTKRHSSSERGH